MRWIYNGVFFFIISLNAFEFSTTNDYVYEEEQFGDNSKRMNGEWDMSDHVFIISEWLPKEGKDQELWQHAKRLMALISKEKGCLRAHATRQIVHPAAPGKSKYTIVCIQEYRNLEAFETHCTFDYVAEFFETYVQDEGTAIVDEWTCRLFNEGSASK